MLQTLAIKFACMPQDKLMSYVKSADSDAGCNSGADPGMTA